MHMPQRRCVSKHALVHPVVLMLLVWLSDVGSQTFPQDTTLCISATQCCTTLSGALLRKQDYGIELGYTWHTNTLLCPDVAEFLISHDLLYPDPPPAESLPFQAGVLKTWKDEGKLPADRPLIEGKRRCGISLERIHEDTFWVEGPTFEYTDLEYRIFEHDLDVDTIYMAVRNITLDSLWLRFDTTSFFGDTGVWVGTMDRPKRSRPGPMFRRPAKVLAVHGGRRPAGPYGVFDIRGREVRVRRSGGLVIVR